MQQLLPNGQIKTIAGDPNGNPGTDNDRLNQPSAIYVDENVWVDVGTGNWVGWFGFGPYLYRPHPHFIKHSKKVECALHCSILKRFFLEVSFIW